MKAILKKNQVMITALAVMIAVAGYLNFAGNQFGEQQLAEGAAESGAEQADADAVEAISALEEEYGIDGALDISDEDAAQAISGDIESLDEDLSVADVEMDEAMAEAGEMETVVPASSEIGEAALAAQETEGAQEAALAAEGAQEAALAAQAAEGTQETGSAPGEAVFTSSAGVGTLSSAKLLKEQTRAKNKEALLDIINNGALSEEQKQEAVSSMIAITDVAEKETAAEILLEAKGFEDVVVSISGDMADVVVGQAELSDAQRAQIEDIIRRKTGIAAENIIISPVIAN